MIEITINGEARQIDGPMPIAELVRRAEVPEHYLAIEINGDVVPRESHATVLVNAGDVVEVVTLVGGG
ncbi:MAG: sulfur carrier protein ThiS [Planctomycetota bacterium]